jgi:tetratricopeptide (TPR) repeat protein
LRFANFAGEFLYYASDYSRAQPYLEAWKRAMPQNINSTLFLAANLLQLGRIDEAYEIARNYSGSEWADVPEAGGWAAYVAYRAGDADQARRWAGIALARHRDQPNAHYVLGLIDWYVDGNLDSALEHLAVPGAIPDFWDILLNPDKGHQVDYDRGRILVEAGDLDAAIESFQRALERDARPYMAEALADAYLAHEQPDAALENLHRALEMTEDPDAQMRLSQRIQALEG